MFFDIPIILGCLAARRWPRRCSNTDEGMAITSKNFAMGVGATPLLFVRPTKIGKLVVTF